VRETRLSNAALGNNKDDKIKEITINSLDDFLMKSEEGDQVLY
jgi:hypothetical protein